LFALRGLALSAGATWPKTWPIRYLSYTIDTTLLTAALMLTAILHQYPFVQAWLTVKVVLLVIYIGLGVYALSYAKTRAARIGCWLAALLVFLGIVSVARAHDPLGALLWVLNSR
jgi:uncharacterized membrane protein SirB2